MYAEVDSRTRAAVWLRAALAIDYKCVDALQVSTLCYAFKRYPSVRYTYVTVVLRTCSAASVFSVNGTVCGRVQWRCRCGTL